MAARVLFTVVFLLALACASRFEGHVTSDPDVDYSRYQTFAFADNGYSDANHQHARAEIQRILESRGRKPAAMDQATARIDVRITSQPKMQFTGASVSGTEGGLIVQVIDASNGSVVWYGWAQETWRDTMDPMAEITKAVEYLFSLYPPSR